MPTESFLEVTLYVADCQRSVEFYDAIGLRMSGYDLHDVPHHADGGTGGVALQLWPAEAGPTSRVQLGFRVKDLEAVARALTDGGNRLRNPESALPSNAGPGGNRVHLSEITPCRSLNLALAFAPATTNG